MSEIPIIYRRCFVCDVSVFELSSGLSQNTQFSGTSVFQLLEQLVGHRICHTETDIWCNECIAKIDNYDQAIFTAKQVQTELLLLLTTTVNKYNEIEIENHKAREVETASISLFKTGNEDTHESSSSNTENDLVTTEYDETLLLNRQVIKPLKLPGKPTSLNRFICDICGQTYKSKGSLEVHLNRHNGVYPHECSICHKKFTQRGSLIRHMLLHTGERPYQCDKCGKKFIHSSSFRMHKLVHNRLRPKKCTICGLAMRSNSQLRIHMLVHSGERSHSCPTCGQKFARRCNMMVHYQAHQGIYRKRDRKNKLSCPICQVVLPNKSKLQQHLSVDHTSESHSLQLEKTDTKVLS